MVALIIVALAGWVTVALLLFTGVKSGERVDGAWQQSLDAMKSANAQLLQGLEDRDTRIHQLEAIADAFRIEALKNPGSIPNTAPMEAQLSELSPEYRSFLDGYDEDEHRQEAEGYIRTRIAMNPDLKPAHVIAELQTG